MKFGKILLLLLPFLLLGLLLRTLWYAGTFKTLSPHTPGEGSFISGMVGAEDITIDPATHAIWFRIAKGGRTGISKDKIFTDSPKKNRPSGWKA